MGVLSFYKGEYVTFKADLEQVGDDVIRVVTEAGLDAGV